MLHSKLLCLSRIKSLPVSELHHFTITMYGAFSESEARSRMLQREGKRQTPTWSCLSHHRDHYLSKTGRGGGGLGEFAFQDRPPLGLSLPPSLTLPFPEEVVPTKPPDCPCSTALWRVHMEEGNSPRHWSGASRQTPPYRQQGGPSLRRSLGPGVSNCGATSPAGAHTNPHPRQIQANQPLKQHLPTVAGVSAKYGACVVWAKQLQWNAVEAL